jgi:2-methylisocitrate lyase-like PEP mutase family enzyme
MSPARYQQFRQLHHTDQPLLLPNAWDARSAATLAAQGYRAVGTSSAALASALGYADGEQLPFAVLRFVAGRIGAATALPVSVDLEGGYSRDPAQVAAHVAELHALGVVGVNLEDSVVTAGQRHLRPAAEFAALLAEVKSHCQRQGIEVFVNARTDTYLLGVPNPLTETRARAAAYAQAGADGLFVPGLADLNQIRELTAASSLPLNVMALPALPDFAALGAAGVRRLSMGNFAYEYAARQHAAVAARVRQQASFSPLFQS